MEKEYCVSFIANGQLNGDYFVFAKSANDAVEVAFEQFGLISMIKYGEECEASAVSTATGIGIRQKIFRSRE